MKIICSWCKKVLGEKEPFNDPSETHARCPECLEKQRKKEELAKVPKVAPPTEKSRFVTLEGGAQGYLTIAGKESPKLYFLELDFSGKSFTCHEDVKPDFEKHIESIKGDEVSVTWLHSMECRGGVPMPKRGKKKRDEPPTPPPPKKEDVHYNCTIRVPKSHVHQIFQSACHRTKEFVTLMADITYDIAKREIIHVDEKIWLFFPTEKDIPSLVELLKDREIYERTCQIPYPYTEEDAKKFIDESDKKRREVNHTMQWAIRSGKTDLIGMIGFQGKSKKDPTVDEVGFWLGKAHWNQGIMTKVLKVITDRGFKEYKLKRIEMNIFSTNKSSIRVAEKCGYKFEKLVPAAYEKDGKKIDAKLYAIENQNVQV